jgi:O-methyltransferase
VLPPRAGSTAADEASDVADDAPVRYLELLKRVLMGTISGAEEFERVTPKRGIKRAVARIPERFGYSLVRVREVDAVARAEGRDWPAMALTMIGRARLDNIESCIRTIIADRVQGDFLEAGVWRGGASIFMRAAADVLGGYDRHLWLADSFRGLPPPSSRFPHDSAVVCISRPSLRFPSTRFVRILQLSDYSTAAFTSWRGFSQTRCRMHRLRVSR